MTTFLSSFALQSYLPWDYTHHFPEEAEAEAEAEADPSLYLTPSLPYDPELQYFMIVTDQFFLVTG